jgi:hypothetical protein
MQIQETVMVPQQVPKAITDSGSEASVMEVIRKSATVEQAKTAGDGEYEV